MGYHLIVETDTQSGKPVDAEKMDEAGGRLLALGPAFGFSEDGPEVSLMLYVERDGWAEAVGDGLEAALAAFESVGEPLTVRSVTAYTEAEFDRVHVVGGPRAA